MKDQKAFFSFTAMPKCMVSDRPYAGDLATAKAKGSLLFIILNGIPPADPKKLDVFISGYLTGCEVGRSEHMAIYFNDTELPQGVAQLKFAEKYKTLKYPDVINGYTTLATGKKANLLSEFLGTKLEKKVEPNGTGV